MRWILILISALFITACGSATTNLNAVTHVEEFELTTQAPAVNYNVLIIAPISASNCNQAINNAFSSKPYLKSAANASNYKKKHKQYCLITLSTSSSAESDLASLKSTEKILEFDENLLYGLDGANSSSFDPTCDQIEAMDVDADLMDQIDNTAFEDATTINNIYVYPGTGVNIAIVGTGLGSDDKFYCNLTNGTFSDHDNHIESIISEIAPNAIIKDYVACTSAGVCPSNEIGNQLLTIWKENNSRQIVNLSLGGHDPDNTHAYIIGMIMKDKALIVASAGNGGSSVQEHYPASFASSVPNMLSVAAVGINKYGVEWANFNTTGVANIAGPGINLCPTTADGFRCGSNDIGISGTSFAAPYVAAVAANYMDRWGWNPSGYWNAEAYRNRMLNRAESIPGISIKRAVYK